jgi:N-acetylneuraminic acid mutarotase
MTTWLFDATTGKWRDLAPKGPTPSRRAAMGISYDRKNGVVVLFGGWGYSGSATPQMLEDTWVYNPVANIWTEMKLEAPPCHKGKVNPQLLPDCQMLAYDEEHNVHVLVLQEWDKNSGIWAYRYK